MRVILLSNVPSARFSQLGEHGFHGKWHLVHHGMGNEGLHAVLRYPHPVFVLVAQTRGPCRQHLSSLHFGQDGHHHPVGIDQRDLQTRGQATVPEGGLAGAIVPRQYYGKRLAGRPLPLQHRFDRLVERVHLAGLNFPPTNRPDVTSPSRTRTVRPGTSGSAW